MACGEIKHQLLLKFITRIVKPGMNFGELYDRSLLDRGLVLLETFLAETLASDEFMDWVGFWRKFVDDEIAQGA